MNDVAADMRALADELSSRPLDDECLRRYHAQAVAGGRLSEALAVYEILMQRCPQHQALRSFYIALCLENGEPGRAMPHIEHLLASAKPDDGLLDVALSVRRRLDVQAVPADAPLHLSLCMIVRDEAARLAACLKAVKPLADDLVIVDTGSTDRTMDIARLFGARVYAFEWGKDFAAARNAALEKARGRWVLILDADEMIAFQDFECLHRLMHEHDDGCTAFSIQTRNYSHNANMIGWQANDGRYAQLEAGIGWLASIKVRLFPRRDDIRFHFPVHERVEPALRKAGVKILTCSVPVHHYGHLDENLNRRKALNYYELGYAKLEQMSGDLQALRELAVQAGQLERWTEALQLWRRLLLIRPDFVEAHVNIAGALWQLDYYDQALAAARKAVEGDPQLREAHFNVAISLMLLKRADEAAALLKTILQAHRDYLPAWFMLAAACRILGKFNDARKLFNLLHERMTESVLVLARKDLAFRLIRAGQAEAGRLLLHDDS